MSVINDMLRDLDARKAPERNGLSGEAHSLVQAQVRPKWYLPLAILLVLGLVLVAFWLGVSSEENNRGHQPLLSDALEGQSEVNNAAELTATPSGNAERENSNSGSSAAALPIASPKSPEQPNEARSVSVKKPQVQAEASRGMIANAVSAPEVETNTQAQSAPHERSIAGQQAASERSTAALQPERTSVQLEKQTAAVSSPSESSNGPDVDATSAINVADQSRSQVRLTPTAQDQQVASQNQKLIDKGQVAFALKQLYAYIAESEDDSYSRAVLATYLLQTQRFAEAGDVLVRVDRDDIPALRLLKARWLAHTDSVNKALTWLETKPPEIPEHADYYSLLANYYQQAGQFEKSVETYAKLLELDSEVADWWLGLGVGYDRLQRYDDATFAYRQAVALPNLKSSLAAFANDRLKQLTR